MQYTLILLYTFTKSEAFIDAEDDTTEEEDTEDDQENSHLTWLTYLAFCLLSPGLVFTSVSVGGPALLTTELQLAGPALLGLGLVLVLLRLLCCSTSLHSHC